MTVLAHDARTRGVIAETIFRSLADARVELEAMEASLRRRGIDPARVPVVVEGDAVHAQAYKERADSKDTFVMLSSPALEAMRRIAA